MIDTPPISCTSFARYFPPGLRSANSGVRANTSATSNKSNAMPASWASAGRCSVAFVLPPVAATTAAAFSSDLRVTICRGRGPSRSRRITASPARSAYTSRDSSTAGGLAEPGSARPIASDTYAMLLAVYCPPQEPAPGQATFSSAVSSSSVMVPAECLPTPSNTSSTVTSRP